MTRSRSFKPLKRSVNRIPLKQRILIFAEGAKTEVDYFDTLRRSYRESAVTLEIFGGEGVPLTLVLKAKARRKLDVSKSKTSLSIKDQYWVVFDRDDHPNISEAFTLARDAGIKIAFSDPCFELWILLHFNAYDKVCQRHNVQEDLARVCDEYDRRKNKSLDFSKIMDRVEIAEQRAESQFQRREDEGHPPNPPFTTVYVLTKIIRGKK